MPTRFFARSRTEPARTIIACICWIVILTSIFTLTPFYVPPGVERLAGAVAANPGFWELLWPALVYIAVSVYGLWACWTIKFKHMANASFMLMLIYLLAGATRMAFTFDPLALTWVTYMTVTVVLSVCYLFMRAEGRKAGEIK